MKRKSCLRASGFSDRTWAGAATISTDFVVGVDGWTVGDTDNVGSPMPTYNATGGSPGGTIETSDIASRVAFFAPSKFLGDLSASYGGTFSSNIADLAGNDGQAYAAVILYGAGQAVSIAHAPPSSTSTLSGFSFTLTESGFDHYAAGGHQRTTPVTEAQFKQVLGNLTDVAIVADWRQ